MSARMRVLLVAAANATSGGGEKHVADLLLRLPAQGVDVALACPAGGDLTSLASELAVPTFPLAIASGFSAGEVRALGHAIREWRPDVVHAHGSRAALFARLADSHARERVVYTVHGIHVDKAGSFARRVAYRRLESSLRGRTARFIAVCASDVVKGGRLGVLDPSRTITVHNGIEITAAPATTGAFRAEIGVAPEAPLVLTVGRFHEQKDQATLIRAWCHASRAVPGAVLALVGSGELEGRLREVASAHGVTDRVRFVRPRASLETAWADADVFALSSRWEGLPYVVLEAMAHRVPVASTDVDGIPEAVSDGVSGLLTPAGDSAALAGSLERLLGDPALRERMGAAGATRVSECFSLERMVDGVVDVYRDVAAERAGR